MGGGGADGRVDSGFCHASFTVSCELATCQLAAWRIKVNVKVESHLNYLARSERRERERETDRHKDRERERETAAQRGVCVLCHRCLLPSHIDRVLCAIEAPGT